MPKENYAANFARHNIKRAMRKVHNATAFLWTLPPSYIDGDRAIVKPSASQQMTELKLPANAINKAGKVKSVRKIISHFIPFSLELITEDDIFGPDWDDFWTTDKVRKGIFQKEPLQRAKKAKSYWIRFSKVERATLDSLKSDKKRQTKLYDRLLAQKLRRAKRLKFENSVNVKWKHLGQMAREQIPAYLWKDFCNDAKEARSNAVVYSVYRDLQKIKWRKYGRNGEQEIKTWDQVIIGLIAEYRNNPLPNRYQRRIKHDMSLWEM